MTPDTSGESSEPAMTDASAPRRPRILCVGAYERDNFGDLLFQIITAEYLSQAGADAVYAAPFEADMTDLLGLKVPAYGPLLENEHFDAVWTVGGEVGGTGLDYAYRTAHGEKAFAEYSAMTPEEKRAILATENGTVPMESPYLPRASAYARNRQAATVMNSVGLAGIQGLGAVRKAGMIGILHEATSITVRDKYASAFLEREGVAHNLEPDLVHSIAVTRPELGADRGDYILIQASTAHLRKYGIQGFAKAIIDSPVLKAHPVRLFTAGTATGHDSFEKYEEILAIVKAADPSRRIEISRTIDPWARVEEIAKAKLWIGSSLHGRIISAAYGVPRVSFAKRKVDDYVRTWDDEMPWGVNHHQMDAAAAKALAMPADDRGKVLGERAHANILGVIEHVTSWAQYGAPADRLERLLDIRNEQWSRMYLEIMRSDAARKAKEEIPLEAIPPTGPVFVRRARRFAARAFRKLGRMAEGR